MDACGENRWRFDIVMRGFTLPAKFGVLILAVLTRTLFAAEPPYKESELGDQLTFTPIQLRAALSDLG